MLWFVLLLISAYCQDKVNSDSSLKVDIYPGYGWDHLRFMELSPIFDVSNFNDSDVLQSCIDLIPVHEKRIELNSEIIDVFDSHNSDYSSNYVISGSARFTKFPLISGSFSRSFSESKAQQAREQSISLRNQIDYILVDVILDASACRLNPNVKKDIIQLGKYLTSEQAMMATYAAQLFVKKYGTHYTNRLLLGGSIVEEDFVRLSDFNKSQETITQIKTAAKLSFYGTFNLTAKFNAETNSSTKDVHVYMKNITRKIVNSKGGNVFKIGDEMEGWLSSIKNFPVIVRRGVENITFFIQSEQIPELDESTLSSVRDEINNAVETYVQMNVLSGCMLRGSPSFNWIANIDDGSCNASIEENTQMGGFIQTCTEDPQMYLKCGSYRILNLYTNDQTCPLGFNKYLLNNITQYEQRYRRRCESCGFLWLDTCCRDVIIPGIGRRDINLYGCNLETSNKRSKSGVLKIEQKYAYGGSYTLKKVNPVTGSTSCPTNFFSVRLTSELYVCLAPVVADTSGLPHFGGFYTCSQGNIQTNMTQNCPTGYSTYVVGPLAGGCLMYSCLKFDDFFDDSRRLPPIVLPPFFSIRIRNETRDVDNGTSDDPYLSTTTIHSPYVNDKNKHLVLGISSTAIAISLLAIGFVLVFQIKHRRQDERMALVNH